MSPGHETFVSRLGLRMRFGLKSVNGRVEKAALFSEDSTADCLEEMNGAGFAHETDSAAETTEATAVGSSIGSSFDGGAFATSSCFDNAGIGLLLFVDPYGTPMVRG